MPVAIDQLLLFLLGSILVNIVPGADMALVMRQVFIGGTALAHRTILGNMTGIGVHAVALAAGLSALLVASSEAFTTMKVAGAVYLVFLGVQTLRSARAAGGPADAVAAATPRRVPSMRQAYLQGLISTVLNPKPALFFLTYVPQFVDESRPVVPQIALFAGVHIALGLIWLTLYTHIVHRAHRTLTRRDVRRWIEGATGVVLIALGLRVALERR